MLSGFTEGFIAIIRRHLDNYPIVMPFAANQQVGEI